MDTNPPVATARAIGYNRLPMSRLSRDRFGLALRLSLLLLALTACGEATPTPFPTVERAAGGGPARTATPPPMQEFTDESGAFSLELPPDWQVVEQGMTRLGRYYQLGPEPVGPGPASSALFVADAGELAAEEAAVELHCADCDEAPELEETTIGDIPARRAMLGSEPALEWFFVEHEGWLIVLTLHDPETLETRADLLETLTLGETGAAEPTEVAPTEAAPTEAPPATTAPEGPPPTPTPPPTATPEPATGLEPPAAWQSVTVQEAAVTFDVPERWAQVEDTLWAPDAESPYSAGFAWGDFLPEPQALLGEYEVAASEPLSLTWGSGVSMTVESDAGTERHALLQVGLRSYDFFARSRTGPLPAALDEILGNILDSVVLEDQLLYLEDPAQAGVDWFAAVLRDPSGREARPYMSAALKERLGSGESPLLLLELQGQRPAVYLVETATSGTTTTELLATLTLSDESEVTRVLRMVFDEQIGWRLDEIVVPGEE